MSAIPRNAMCPCGSGRKHKLCHGKTVVRELNTKRDRIDVMVCMASRGSIAIETHQALSQNMDGLSIGNMHVVREPIDTARNSMALQVLRYAENTDIEFVLSVDDDMFWPRGTVRGMMESMRADRRIDVLAGWFCIRAPGAAPMCSRRLDTSHAYPHPGVDMEIGDIVEVELVGFPFVMYRPELLRKLGPNPFTLPDFDSASKDVIYSEDFAFCRRVREIGGRIFVHSGAWVAHVETATGLAFLPGQAPMRIVDGHLRRTGMTFTAPDGSEIAPESRSYGKTIDDSFERLRAIETA